MVSLTITYILIYYISTISIVMIYLNLQGHSYPVIGIAWNHGENFLASSDFGGSVIVWKREKTK